MANGAQGTRLDWWKTLLAISVTVNVASVTGWVGMGRHWVTVETLDRELHRLPYPWKEDRSHVMRHVDGSEQLHETHSQKREFILYTMDRWIEELRELEKRVQAIHNGVSSSEFSDQGLSVNGQRQQ